MSTANPIVTEVLRNAFHAIADDMITGLIRSAYSPIIYQVRDTAVALMDRDHRVLGCAVGVPFFLGTLDAAVDSAERMLGSDIWREGDVWLVNDSELAGGHLPDIIVFGPIFYRGRLVGFSASQAHHMDIGAKDPGGGSTDATEIFQEGIRLGPIKFMEGGKIRGDFADLLSRNSRLPGQLAGDLAAQVNCCAIGESRLRELLDRYGEETAWAARDEIFRQTAELDRVAVRNIPDGIYHAEGFLDSDGVQQKNYRIALTVEITGDRMILDLTDCAEQAKGPINCGRAMTMSACRCAFKRLINPMSPVNGGSFQPMEVKLRDGSLLAARAPAPCYYFYSALGLLVDLLPKALAQVLPEATAAGQFGDSCNVFFAGVDPRTGKRFVSHQAQTGGWGAWRGGDGESALFTASITRVKDLPVEIFETKFPLRVTNYAMRPDSAGAGEWRGGYGSVRRYVVEADDITLTTWFERSKTPAWGLFDAESGQPPSIALNPGTTSERQFLKVNALPLKRGDVLVSMTGGGGGYGNVKRRPIHLVAQEVRDKLLSEQAALSQYGYTVSELLAAD